MRLLNIRSISRLRFAKTGIKVGRSGRKLTVPKEIWLLSIVELLRDEGKKAIKSMTPTPKLPTVGAN
jgi:hypothetical protein